MKSFKINIPKKIKIALDKLQESGFEAFIVGGCVRDSFLRKDPHDWDIATSATPKEIQEAFQNYDVIETGMKYGTLTVVIDKEPIEITTYRIDGDYSDGRRPDEVTFTRNIEEDLSRRDYTINACASTGYNLIDPFGGQEDAKNRLIRCVGNPSQRFTEDALRILRGIRFAAQLDFDLQMDTFEAMKEKAFLLESVSVERIRMEFEKIVMAENSGKGLRMCMAAGVLPYILGEECMKNMNKSEIQALTELAENIDKANSVKEIRLALVYLCFEKNKALIAMDRLNYDNKTNKMLKTAQNLLEELSFINDRVILKKFIFRVGYEMYDYLENLSRQQRKVYDYSEYKIRNRMTIFDDIKKFKECILLEELAVNGDDLMDLGIKEGEDIGKMLNMLIDVVHKNPSCNKKEILLKKALEFKKNPISALLRGVRWYK